MCSGEYIASYLHSLFRTVLYMTVEGKRIWMRDRCCGLGVCCRLWSPVLLVKGLIDFWGWSHSACCPCRQCWLWPSLVHGCALLQHPCGLCKCAPKVVLSVTGKAGISASGWSCKNLREFKLMPHLNRHCKAFGRRSWCAGGGWTAVMYSGILPHLPSECLSC